MREQHHVALQSLLDEHRAITTTLHAASRLLQRPGRPSADDFASLRAMLLFVDDFCEMEHHHKESESLFAKIRARAPQARHLLDELDRQHAVGERRIRELGHALTRFEMGGEDERRAFAEALSRYVCFYLGHMEIEEKQLFPVAEDVLTDTDWEELHQAGHARLGASPFQSLFDRFAKAWPAQAGHISPWWREAAAPSHADDAPGVPPRSDE